MFPFPDAQVVIFNHFISKLHIIKNEKNMKKKPLCLARRHQVDLPPKNNVEWNTLILRLRPVWSVLK